MATQAVTSGGEVVDGGTILQAGNVASGRFNNLSQLTNVEAQLIYGSDPKGNEYNGVQSAQKGATVTIADITERGSTDRVNIESTGHGLAVGAMIFVEGTVPTNYNVTHRVTEIVDSNNFATNVLFTVIDSTEGDYREVSGSFATMVQGRFIGRYMSGGFVANVANTIMDSPASNYHRRFNNPINDYRRLDEVSWDYVTGAVTKGANAGALVTYIDPLGDGSDPAVDSAAILSYAVPGEFAYMDGNLIPIQANYPARTST